MIDRTKKIGLGLLLAFGAILIALGIKNIKKPCREGAYKCVGTDLYTCVNGKWMLTEEDSPYCVPLPGITFISGTVRSALSNQPISGVEVAAKNTTVPGVEQITLTDENGYYKFVGILPGLIYIRFSHPDYLPCRIDTTLTAETPLRVDVKLEPKYPPIPVSEFHFTEIVENHLPEYIIGWAEATCSGYYNYVPPTGYSRVSCEYGDMGSHGGCPSCFMVLVRCDKIS